MLSIKDQEGQADRLPTGRGTSVSVYPQQRRAIEHFALDLNEAKEKKREECSPPEVGDSLIPRTVKSNTNTRHKDFSLREVPKASLYNFLQISKSMGSEEEGQGSHHFRV
jgi:hypothetical protein